MRSHTLHRIRRLALAAAFVLAIATPSAAHAVSMHWTGRTVLDSAPPFANTHSLFGVSCAGTTLCVAVDSAGNVATSADPTGGSPTGCTLCSWTSTEIDTGHSINAIACPTSSLCVAVDDAGDVLTSTQPNGGATAWQRTNVDGTNGLTDVSCASNSLCVAVDNSGNVVSSANPTGGASAWNVAQVDGANGLTGVSCPTSGLCVAVDDGGNVVTSTNPSAGASAWAAPVNVSSSGGLTAITCPSTAVCVAADDSGNIVTSADPTGGSGQWSAASVDSASFVRSISCPTTTLCVGVDDDGNDVVSTNPLGGAAAWSSPANIEAATDVTIWGVSCPTTSLCFAVTDAGKISWSTDFVGTPSTSPLWHGPYNIAGQHVIGGASCPSLAVCVAASDSGNEITSVGTDTAPAALASPWGAPGGGTGVGGQLRAMSCSPSGRLCVGVGGVMIGSSDAGRGPGAHWFDFGPVAGSGELQGVSCPTDRFCQAVDDSGHVMSLIDQSGTGSQFPLVTGGPPNQVDGSNVIHAVSCPSVSLCVAVDGAGNALISTNPAQGVWGTKPVDPGHELFGVSCPTTAVCLAVDDNGAVVTINNPGANPTATVATYDGGHALDAISCTTSLCVAVDDSGQALSSTNAGAALPAWSLGTIAAGRRMVSVSCAPEGLCVAGDDDGGAIAGAVPAPAATTSAPQFTGPTAADVSGTANPNGSTLSDCHFNFGTTTAYGHSVPCVATPSGTSSSTVTAHITGLSPNTAFHVQLVAGNAGGLSKAEDRQGTTPPLRPTIGPRSATSVLASTATLTAWVNPNGGALTGCRFVYGTTMSYGGSVPCRQTVGGGVVAVQVSAALTGLKANTAYHFTLIADNPGGESKGTDAGFRTATLPAARVAGGGAVRHGTTTVQLRCQGTTGLNCSGRIVLTLRVHNRAVTIGTARYRLVAPHAGQIRIHLTALALRRLAAAPRHRLSVVAVLIPASGASTRITVQLHR